MVSTEEVLKTVTPQLKELEPVRIDYLSQNRKFLVATIPIWVITLIGFGYMLFALVDPIAIFLVCTITFIMTFIVPFIIFRKVFDGAKEKYVTTYKRIVVQEILKGIDSNLIYEVKQGVLEEEFTESELYKNPNSSYNSKDLIKGYYGKTKVNFSEVCAKEEFTSGNDDSVHYKTIFNGIYFMADCRMDFIGHTIVLPGRAENPLEQLLTSRSKGYAKLIKMDASEFKQAFIVYSTDKMECRDILSSSMMQSILKMKSRLNSRDIKIAFKNRYVYIGVPYKNMTYLEPDMYVPATAEMQIRNFINEIERFLKIVEDLNLNTRLWTKE